MNNFVEMAKINVSEHIEKKNGLSYLSWAWAVDQLMRHDPEANWVYNEPTVFPGGTMMVSCSVTAKGKTMTMQLPVMDYKNKAIADPDAFAVNTAMMRCLVKAISLHGLGLYIYAGEDLPLEVVESINEHQVETLTKLISDVGADPVKFNAYFGIKTLEDLPVTSYSIAEKKLTSKKGAK